MPDSSTKSSDASLGRPARQAQAPFGASPHHEPPRRSKTPPLAHSPRGPSRIWWFLGDPPGGPPAVARANSRRCRMSAPRRVPFGAALASALTTLALIVTPALAAGPSVWVAASGLNNP